jgi:hypothetical protein
MEKIPEILASAGAIAILAAAVGGGLRGLGFEIPALLKTKERVIVMLVGVALLGTAIYLSRSKDLPPTKPEISGLNAVDFRSSDDEQNDSYLLITTDIDFVNSKGSPDAIMWASSEATLTIANKQIPLKPYYFTRLTNDEKLWYGENYRSQSPQTIKPGENFVTDVMFIAEHNGVNRYMWSQFIDDVLNEGYVNPKFSLALRWTVKDVEQPPIRIECTVQLQQFIVGMKQTVASRQKQFHVTAECKE